MSLKVEKKALLFISGSYCIENRSVLVLYAAVGPLPWSPAG